MRGPAGRIDRWVAFFFGLAVAALLAFILLPVVAIFARVPPGILVAQLHSRVALDALEVSLRASLSALAVILLFGTPAAYALATRPRRHSATLTTILELPLVLPPPVAGLGLLMAFGREGLLGGPLRAVGVTITFTQIAVVMALVFVSLPFFVRQAIASFQSVDPQLIAASRILGAGQARTFFRVALPLARPGLSAGAALALARSLGEFGATLMFAGSLPGSTQTLPVAVFTELARDLDAALAIAALLVAISAGLFVGFKLLLREPHPSWLDSSSSTSAIV
jgi:molybdate transport system permease protein